MVWNKSKLPGPLDYGLMRAVDMINCDVALLASLMSEIELQCGILRNIECGGIKFSEGPDDPVSRKRKERARGWFGEVAQKVAVFYEWQAVSNRIQHFMGRIEKESFSNRDLHGEIKAIKDAIEDGLKRQLIYRYPNAQNNILMNWKTEWGPVIKAHPETRDEIFAGVDLWCLGHSTASVFHFMRVLEFGLADLAMQLNVSFETETWQVVINNIESAIKAQQKTLPRGSKKNEKLQFYAEAAKEFAYFKDGWRNYVSHNKVTHDEHTAQSTMVHVRQFMTILARGSPNEVLN